MPAGDRTQIGKAYKVEYGAFTYAGYQPTSAVNTTIGDVETIRDTRNAAITHIITNPGHTLSLTCYIESTGSITPPAVGSYISVTPPNKTHPEKYIIASPPNVTHGNSVTTMSLSLLQEDSMEATYNTSATLNVSAVNYDLSDDLLSSVLTLTFNDATAVTSITSDTPATLTPTTHWSVSSTTLTITATYLNSVLTDPDDVVVLTINLNVGNPITLTITAIA